MSANIFLLNTGRISIWVAAERDFHQQSQPCKLCSLFSKIKLFKVIVSIAAGQHRHNLKYGQGYYTKDDIHHEIDEMYEEIIFWRQNLFKLLSGHGATRKKSVISESTKWVEFWNQDVIEFKDIALKSLMVMPGLQLQKPTFKITAKEHSQYLSRHLTQWELARWIWCIAQWGQHNSSQTAHKSRATRWRAISQNLC